MKREIPQKIDKPTRRLGSQVYSTAKNGKVGSILLRRTRSASILGCLLTLGAFGGLLPQMKAAQAFDSAPYQSLGMGLQESKPVYPSKTLIFSATSLNSLVTEPSSTSAPSSLLAPQSGSALSISFTQSNLLNVDSLLSPTLSNSAISTNILDSLERLDLGSNNSLLALETGTAIPSLISESTAASVINVDDLLSTKAVSPEVSPQADVLNPSNPEQSSLSTSPDIGGLSNRYTDLPKSEAESEQVATLRSRGESQEPIPDSAVLPDIDLSEAIISNDQNSALIESGAVVHKVRPGETLEEISQRYDISTQEIIRANDLRNPDAISSVKTLRIPAHQSLSLAINSSEVSPLNAVSEAALAADETSPGSDRARFDANTSESDQAQGEDLSTQPSLSQGLGQPLAVLSPSSASSQVPAPESGLDQSNPLAFRTIFPQVPSLELPPLSPADSLPIGTLIGSQTYVWPAQGVFTSGYGWRWGRMHRGIDIAAPIGTPVVASATGTVTTAGWNEGGYGNLVEVLHPDGSLTLYAHNNSLKTRVGETVYQGQQIAEMGTTGRSTGPHTHFELHPMGKGAMNPVPYLRHI